MKVYKDFIPEDSKKTTALCVELGLGQLVSEYQFIFTDSEGAQNVHGMCG